MLATRQGISLVETTVVIAIITILVSMSLVAVQGARESSRRIQCQNNLHQIGIAITNFTQSTRAFPSLFANRGTKVDAALDQSAFVTILPELEVIFIKSDPNFPTDDPKNLPPSILRCPAGNELLGYRYSYGSGVRTLDKLDGILRPHKGLNPAEVTDGLSNTSLMAERMSGKEHSKPIGMALFPIYLTDSRFADDCMQLNTTTAFVTDVGVHWQGYQPRDLVYSHFSSPNNTHWDCQGGFLHQLISARSYHRGGVLVLFADGRVTWVSKNMDVTTWRALGTVAGNEPISDTP